MTEDDRQLDEDTQFFATWEEKRERYLEFVFCTVCMAIVGILFFVLVILFRPSL
ncbi:MAG: hypothetical protein ACW99U_11445 [Candidatus Thorarchaeota archaeon]